MVKHPFQDLSFKWSCRFGHFLQYTSGPEVLASSLDTNLNYAPTVLFLEPLSNVAATFRKKMWKLFGCILVDMWPQQYSLLDSKPSAGFSAKCLNSLVEIPKIPSWFCFGFGLFVLPLCIGLICYLLDS